MHSPPSPTSMASPFNPSLRRSYFVHSPVARCAVTSHAHDEFLQQAQTHSTRPLWHSPYYYVSRSSCEETLNSRIGCMPPSDRFCSKSDVASDPHSVRRHFQYKIRRLILRPYRNIRFDPLCRTNSSAFLHNPSQFPPTPSTMSDAPPTYAQTDVFCPLSGIDHVRGVMIECRSDSKDVGYFRCFQMLEVNGIPS
jgi:hypothetical protein